VVSEAPSSIARPDVGTVPRRVRIFLREPFLSVALLLLVLGLYTAVWLALNPSDALLKACLFLPGEDQCRADCLRNVEPWIEGVESRIVLTNHLIRLYGKLGDDEHVVALADNLRLIDTYLFSRETSVFEYSYPQFLLDNYYRSLAQSVLAKCRISLEDCRTQLAELGAHKRNREVFLYGKFLDRLSALYLIQDEHRLGEDLLPCLDTFFGQDEVIDPYYFSRLLRHFRRSRLERDQVLPTLEQLALSIERHQRDPVEYLIDWGDTAHYFSTFSLPEAAALLPQLYRWLDTLGDRSVAEDQPFDGRKLLELNEHFGNDNLYQRVLQKLEPRLPPQQRRIFAMEAGQHFSALKKFELAEASYRRAFALSETLGLGREPNDHFSLGLILVRRHQYSAAQGEVEACRSVADAEHLSICLALQGELQFSLAQDLLAAFEKSFDRGRTLLLSLAERKEFSAALLQEDLLEEVAKHYLLNKNVDLVADLERIITATYAPGDCIPVPFPSTMARYLVRRSAPLGTILHHLAQVRESLVGEEEGPALYLQTAYEILTLAKAERRSHEDLRIVAEHIRDWLRTLPVPAPGFIGMPLHAADLVQLLHQLEVPALTTSFFEELSVRLPVATGSEVLTQAGHHCFDQTRYEQALWFYRRTRELLQKHDLPIPVDVVFQSGLAEVRLGRFEGASQSLRQCMQQFPDRKDHEGVMCGNLEEEFAYILGKDLVNSLRSSFAQGRERLKNVLADPIHRAVLTSEDFLDEVLELYLAQEEHSLERDLASVFDTIFGPSEPWPWSLYSFVLGYLEQRPGELDRVPVYLEPFGRALLRDGRQVIEVLTVVILVAQGALPRNPEPARTILLALHAWLRGLPQELALGSMNEETMHNMVEVFLTLPPPALTDFVKLLLPHLPLSEGSSLAMSAALRAKAFKRIQECYDILALLREQSAATKTSLPLPALGGLADCARMTGRLEEAKQAVEACLTGEGQATDKAECRLVRAEIDNELEEVAASKRGPSLGEALVALEGKSVETVLATIVPTLEPADRFRLLEQAALGCMRRKAHADALTYLTTSERLHGELGLPPARSLLQYLALVHLEFEHYDESRRYITACLASPGPEDGQLATCRQFKAELEALDKKRLDTEKPVPLPLPTLEQAERSSLTEIQALLAPHSVGEALSWLADTARHYLGNKNFPRVVELLELERSLRLHHGMGIPQRLEHDQAQALFENGAMQEAEACLRRCLDAIPSERRLSASCLQLSRELAQQIEQQRRSQNRDELEVVLRSQDTVTLSQLEAHGLEILPLPERRQLLLDLGSKRLESKRFTEALTFLEAARALYPKGAVPLPARYQLAVVALELGKKEDAKAHATSCTEGNDARIRKACATLLAEIAGATAPEKVPSTEDFKNLEGATLADLRKAGLDRLPLPERRQLLLDLGSKRLESKHFAESLAFLEAARALYPKGEVSTVALYHLAVVLLELGRKGEAATTARTCLARGDAAQSKNCEELLREAERPAAALPARGSVEDRLHELLSKVENLNCPALLSDKDYLSLPTHMQRDGLAAAGKIYLGRSSFRDAAAAFEAARKLSVKASLPIPWEVHYGQALAAVELREWNQAKTSIGRCLAQPMLGDQARAQCTELRAEILAGSTAKKP